MAALPICDELRRSVGKSDWEPQFIFRCRTEISEDLRLAREIKALCMRLSAIVDEREVFADELDMLAGKHVPDKMAEFTKQYVEERLVHYKKNKDVLTNKINALNFDVQLRDKVLAEYTKNLEKAEKERDELKLILEKLKNSYKSLNTLLESQVSDKDKTRLGYKAASPTIEGFVNSSKILEKQENKSDKGYHEVPSPFIENYMPSKCNLRLIDEHFEMQTFGSGNTFLLAMAFFFRQWEVPSGSGNFLTSSGNALCILFPTIFPKT
nr:hypothetical protein [Tanacetum cinerariifolium]